jgi:hypothetical protein
MAATTALNTGISQDVWRVIMFSVLPFLAKPFGSSYCEPWIIAQQIVKL